MPTRQASAISAILALVEVLVAFAVVHVCFRALKHFTEIGRIESAAQLNFTPGVVMILFTTAILLLWRRSFGSYGLSFERPVGQIALGMVAGVLLIAVAAAALAITRIDFDPSRPVTVMGRAIGGGVVGLLATALLLPLLRYEEKVRRARDPQAWVYLLVFFLALPTAAATAAGASASHAALTTAWLFFGAGFGEEVFFRGYIQSRVDLAMHHRVCVQGVPIGPGLVVSALLFGFLHALNTVDYFHGRFTFAWWYALQSFFMGLFYGLLRAKSGRVLPAAVAHGLGDVCGRVPQWIGIS